MTSVTAVRETPESAAVHPADRHVSPWKLGGLTVGALARRVWKEANDDEIFDRAAGLSYYFVFALFPALLFLTALLGMLPIPDLMDRLMSYVEQAMPGDAASIMQKTLGEIVIGAKGSLLSIGALAALWAASGGVASMMTALSVAYDVEDQLGNTVGLGAVAVKVWNVAQWPVAIGFVVAAVALMYYVAPAVEQRRWYWVTPGSLVATVAWIAMSLGLRF
jgi:membrane protein